MSLPADSLPLGLQIIGAIGFFIILLWAVRQAPWRALRMNGLVHVWLAAIVLVGFLWNMQVGVHGLLLVALPVWVAHQTHWWLRKRLPLNPFVFFLGSGFFGGMVSLAAPIFASAALLLVFEVQPGWVIWKDYLALLPLILFPEGFINGAVMTALAVWHPQWVRSFDDEDYLR